MDRPPMKDVSLTGPEIKLILRLRQLRKTGQTTIFMVTTAPLSLSVMGKVELLENIPMSGSFGGY